MPGPRLIASGRTIVMTGGHDPFWGVFCDGPWACVAGVRGQAYRGARVVKVAATGGVYGRAEGEEIGTSELGLEELRAAVQEAHRLGLRVASHAVGREGIDSSVEAGCDIVVATGKGGKVLGHVLATGELLWETPVGVHQNDDLEALDGPTEVWPGTFGGVLTPPSSADGVVYVATLNAPTTLSPNVPAYIGSQLYTAPGQVVAIDAATGDILWDVTLEGDLLGATTVEHEKYLRFIKRNEMARSARRISPAPVWIGQLSEKGQRRPIPVRAKAIKQRARPVVIGRALQ